MLRKSKLATTLLVASATLWGGCAAPRMAGEPAALTTQNLHNIVQPEASTSWFPKLPQLFTSSKPKTTFEETPSNLMSSPKEASNKPAKGKPVDPLDVARVQERRGQMAAAVQIYKRELEKTPNNPKIHHRLAVIAAREERWDDAREQFRIAQQLAPNDSELLSDLGYFLYLQHQLSDAEACLRAAVEANPRNKAAFNNLGIVVGVQGNFEDSLACFRRAGSDAEAYTNLGYVHMQLGDIDKAMEQLNRALTLDSEMRPAALAILQLNDLKHRLDPNSPAQIARRKAMQANQPAETARPTEIAATTPAIATPATATPAIAPSAVAAPAVARPALASPPATMPAAQAQRAAALASEARASEATGAAIAAPATLPIATPIARGTHYQAATLPAVAQSSTSAQPAINPAIQPATPLAARVLAPESRVPQLRSTGPTAATNDYRSDRIATLPTRSPAPAAFVGSGRPLGQAAERSVEAKPANIAAPATSYPIAAKESGSPAQLEPAKTNPLMTSMADKSPTVPSHPLPGIDGDPAISVVPASAQLSVASLERKAPLTIVRSAPPLAVVAKAENPVKVYTPSARLQHAREQDQQEKVASPGPAAEALIHNSFVEPKIREELISLNAEDVVVPADGLLSHSEMLRSTVATNAAPESAAETAKQSPRIHRTISDKRRVSNQTPDEFPQVKIPRAEDFIPVQGRTNQLPTHQLYPTAQPTWTPEVAALQNAGNQNTAAAQNSKRQAPVRVSISAD